MRASHPGLALLVSASLAALATTRAHAQDAFGYEPGQSAGQLHDPLSAHSPWRVDGSGLQGGTYLGYASDPVYGCELDPGTMACITGIAPWVTNDFMWAGDVVASLPGGRFAVGGGTRVRLSSGAGDGLPEMLQGASTFERPQWEDLRVSGRMALEPGERLGVAPLLSVRLDRDTRLDPSEEVSSDSLALGPLYGLGNSLGVAVPVGFTLQRLPLHFSFDPEAAISVGPNDSATEGTDLGLHPMKYWGRARAGAVWVPAKRLAVLSEVELRAREDPSLNTFSRSIEVRAGVRQALLGDRLHLTTVVGSSPLRALGSPGFRGGVALRWTGHEAVAAEENVVPGSRPLRLEVLGPDGASLSPTVTLDGQIMVAQETGGSLVVQVPPGPHTLGLDVAGHAVLNETVEAPEPPGDTDWTLRRVLPMGGGAGVLRLDLRDPTGRPLPEVEVALQRDDPGAAPVDLGDVCGDCELTYRNLPTGPWMLALSAPGMTPSTAPIQVGDTPPDPLDAIVFLSPPVGQLDIVVRDEAGRPIPDARVLLAHPNGSSTVTLNTAGRVQPVVAPGRWLLDVSADGRGRQLHELVVEPFVPMAHHFTIDLMPMEESDATLHVEVVDADGHPVQGARIASGDRVLSTTASGGKVSIEGLAAGEMSLFIDHDDFRSEPVRTISLGAGEETGVSVVLGWSPGALVLRATDPFGRPVDSTVRIEGEGQTLLERTGPDGLLGRTLDSGTWRVALVDDRHQPVAVDLAVDTGRNTVLAVELVAHPVESEPRAGADLTVRVVDETRQPVEGARVRLGDRLLGATSTEGQLHAAGVSPGQLQVAVDGRYFDPWSDQLAVAPGEQEEVLASLRSRLGRVELMAADPEGAPISAQVRVTGTNGQTSLTRLGTNGRRQYRLAPGNWEFAFASERNGFGLEDLEVIREQEFYELQWIGGAPVAPATLPALPRREVAVQLWSRPAEGPTPGVLRMLGPDVMAPIEVGPDGVWSGELRLGEWEALATAPELGIGGADLPLVAGEEVASLHIELGEVSVELTTDEVTIDDTLYFGLGSADLQAQAQKSLEAVARTLRGNPQIRKVRIEGHADQSGSAELNQTLSEVRAANVRDALLALDVGAHRLEAVGHGESRQVTTSGAGGPAQNRRVVFRVIDVRDAVEVPAQ